MVVVMAEAVLVVVPVVMVMIMAVMMIVVIMIVRRGLGAVRIVGHAPSIARSLCDVSPGGVSS